MPTDTAIPKRPAGKLSAERLTPEEQKRRIIEAARTAGACEDVLHAEAVSAVNGKLRDRASHSFPTTVANARDCSQDDNRVNALSLVDAQGGLLWSLRCADAPSWEASQVA